MKVKMGDEVLISEFLEKRAIVSKQPFTVQGLQGFMQPRVVEKNISQGRNHPSFSRQREIQTFACILHCTMAELL